MTRRFVFIVGLSVPRGRLRELDLRPLTRDHHPKNGINVPADKAAAILANPAGHYFNVHTALNPNGAMRGQLSRPA
jgi:hypothetical protein